MDVHLVSWNKLSFVPGSELSEASTFSLPPSGTLGAIGIFDANETSMKTRIDNIICPARKIGLDHLLIKNNDKLRVLFENLERRPR